MNFPGAIGLARAIDYLLSLGMEDIGNREKDLLKYATERMLSIDGLRIYGNSPYKISVISFLLKGIHMYDTGMILDKLGIAVRTGTHCAQPVMERFGIEGTVRASMCFYNTYEEIDRLCSGIEKVITMFS